MDPRYLKLARELFGDSGVGDNDHDIVLKLLSGWEIPHLIGSGRLIHNGIATPWTANRLIKDGPKIMIHRVWDVATVPSKPDRIQLGLGTTATHDPARTQCETPITAAMEAQLGPSATGTTVALTTTNTTVPHTDDTSITTRVYNGGAPLTLSSSPRVVTEMALLNSDGTVLGWGRLFLASSKSVATNDTLTSNYRVQAVP